MYKTLIATFAAGLCVNAAELDNSAKTFLENNCYECHDEDVQKGNLDLSSLKFDLKDRKTFNKWVKVYDNVSHGDMPPKKKKQPEAAAKQVFLSTLETPLFEADAVAQEDEGRGRIRRLNREEFEATLSDLLGMKLDIAPMLPEDAKGDGFDTVGEALNVSSVQMQAYLEAIDAALDQATNLYEKPRREKYTLKHRESHYIMVVERRSNAYRVEDDGVVFFSPQKHSYQNTVLSQYVVPFDGKYKVSVTAKTVQSDKPEILKVRLGGNGHGEKDTVPKTLLGFVDVNPGEYQDFHFEERLTLGQYFRLYPAVLPYMRFNGKWALGQEHFKGPGIKVSQVVVEGPIIEEWPLKPHKVLWGDTPTKRIPKTKPNLSPNRQLDKKPTRVAKPRLTKVTAEKVTGNKFVYDPEKQKAGGELIYKDARTPKYRSTREFMPTNAKEDAAKLLSNFLPKAYRRAVSEEELAEVVGIVHGWMDQGVSFEEAMRTGYKVILTSPEFLFQKSAFSESASKITDLAFAERLAFFLWSSIPDKELLSLVESGEIRQPEVLQAQVERMLKDSRSKRFVDNFLGQWLDLRLLDFTSPDSKLYPEYDALLQWSMEKETVAFFNELLSKDLSVLNFIDSDFVMINERLAKHYDLPPVKGTNIRRVVLPEDSPRGGVIGMASVHKVTANGTTTSPVVRGVWMLERIMGIHPPPPPPGVPAIEPDIRGAVSVLDQLEKHRDNKKCASCHMLIDPPGVALECFDVIGGFRKDYRALKAEKAKLTIRYSPDGPPPIFYHKGQPVISANQMRDGRKFSNIEEFKQVLLEDPRSVAKNVTEKLVTYSTGSGVSFGDRKEIMSIVDRIEEKNFGLRTLIHEIVKSKIFERK